MMVSRWNRPSAYILVLGVLVLMTSLPPALTAPTRDSALVCSGTKTLGTLVTVRELIECTISPDKPAQASDFGVPAIGGTLSVTPTPSALEPIPGSANAFRFTLTPQDAGTLTVQGSLANSDLFNGGPFAMNVTGVEAFTPSNGTSCGNTTVTVTGIRFGLKASELQSVMIGGLPCSNTTWVSDEKVICTTANGITENYVVVKSKRGEYSSFNQFKVIEESQPLVKVVLPKSISAKSTSTVIIAGSHLGVNASMVESVTLAGVTATDCVWESSKIIRCKAQPSNNPIIGPAVVTSKAQSSLCPNVQPNANFFYAGPIINSAEPPSGPAYGLFVMTIRGAYFGDTPTDLLGVTVAGVPCVEYAYLDASSLSCKAGVAPGEVTGPITVTTKDGGTGTSSFNFAYVGSNTRTLYGGKYLEPPPLITDVQPDRLRIQGGQYVTISGSHLGADPEDIILLDIGGVECVMAANGWKVDPNKNSTGTLICLTQPAPKGMSNCTVTTREGGPGIYDKQIELYYAGFVDVKAETTTTNEDGDMIANVAVSLTIRPKYDVTIQVTSDKQFESSFSPSELNFSPGDFDVPKTIQVIGSYDHWRDGPKEYQVMINADSNDELFQNIVIPNITMINLDSTPQVNKIIPENCPLNGTYMTILGLNFDDVVERLEIATTNITDGISYITIDNYDISPTPGTGAAGSTGNTTASGSGGGGVTTTNGTRLVLRQFLDESKPQTSTVGLSFRAPPYPSGGYVDILIFNANGTVGKASNILFYTDDCVDELPFGRGEDCQECPPGGICRGGYRIWPKAGFWNGDEDDGSVTKCDPSEKCLGCDLAQVPSECYASGEGAPCAEGYNGAFCSVCAENWYRVGQGTRIECEECPAVEGLIILIFFDVLVWICVAMAAWWLKTKQNLGLITDFILAVQEVGQVGLLIQRYLPQWLQGLYGTFGLFSGDISFMKPACNQPIEFEKEYLLAMGYVIAIGIPLYVGIPLVKRASLRWHQDESAEFLSDISAHFDDRLYRAATLHLMLVYLPTTQRAVGVISCRKQNGEWVRSTDPKYKCYTSNHMPVFMLAWVVIIVETVGFPLFMLLFYKKNRERLLKDRRFAERWDFLSEPYKVNHYQAWLLECVQLFFLSLSGTIFASDPNFSLVAQGGTFAVVGIYILIFRPFHKEWENWVMLFFKVANIMSMILIWMYSLDTEEETVVPASYKTLVIYIIVLMIFLGIGMLGGSVFYNIIVVKRKWRRRRGGNRHGVDSDDEEYYANIERNELMRSGFFDEDGQSIEIDDDDPLKDMNLVSSFMTMLSPMGNLISGKEKGDGYNAIDTNSVDLDGSVNSINDIKIVGPSTSTDDHNTDEGAVGGGGGDDDPVVDGVENDNVDTAVAEWVCLECGKAGYEDEDECTKCGAAAPE